MLALCLILAEQFLKFDPKKPVISWQFIKFLTKILN